MSETNNNMEEKDPSRIDSHDEAAIEDLVKKYPNLSADKVVTIIKQAGPQRTDIESELELLNQNLGS
ncbi:DUF3606 domain-containing protein [Aridibaculum aurantiacum]|uniref:DUF3606 domain-containing protein n=1 Tax=Aridibaculum aurantiacum TaxID=2810307 RepID=UPI001A96C12A|nr:DUF3606 domain-containing protein [Aridibaculum aurantiacum]